MSIGRNKGSKSSSSTNRASGQTTNYGAGDAFGLQTGKGNISVETLDDDIANAAIGATQKNFSELIGYAQGENERDANTLRGALESVQTIAEDKATGVQQAQRMAMYGVAGVVLVSMVLTNSKKKAS